MAHTKDSNWSLLVTRKNDKYEVCDWDVNPINEERENNFPEQIKFLTVAGPTPTTTKRAINELLRDLNVTSDSEKVKDLSICVRKKDVKIPNGRGNKPFACCLLGLKLYSTNDEHLPLLSFCAKVSSLVCVVIYETHEASRTQALDTLEHIRRNCEEESMPAVWLMLVMSKKKLEDRGFGPVLSKPVTFPIGPKTKRSIVLESHRKNWDSVESLLRSAKDKRFMNVVFSATPIRALTNRSDKENKQYADFLRSQMKAQTSPANLENVQDLRNIGASLFVDNYSKNNPQLEHQEVEKIGSALRAKMILEQHEYIKKFLEKRVYEFQKLTLMKLFENDDGLTELLKRLRQNQRLYFEEQLRQFNKNLTWVSTTAKKLNEDEDHEDTPQPEHDIALRSQKVLYDLTFLDKMTEQDQETMLHGHFTILNEIVIKLAIKYSVSKYTKNLNPKHNLKMKLKDFKKLETRVSKRVLREIFKMFEARVECARVRYLIEAQLKCEGELSIKLFQKEVEDFNDQLDEGMLASIKLLKRMYKSQTQEVSKEAKQYNKAIFKMIINYENPQPLREECSTRFDKFIELQKENMQLGLPIPTNSTGSKEHLAQLIGLIQNELTEIAVESIVAIEALIHIANANGALKDDKNAVAVEQQNAIMQDVADGLFVTRYKADASGNYGMTECKNCFLCKKSDDGKGNNIYTGAVLFNGIRFKFKELLSCNSESLIYFITCAKPGCKGIRYIGKTKNSLKSRMSSYQTNIKKGKSDRLVDKHFYQNGHSFDDFRVTALFTTMERYSSRNEHQTIFAFKSMNHLTGGLNDQFSSEAAGLIYPA